MYYEHLDDIDFQFSYRTLPDELRLSVKNMMNSLYEYWRDRTFPEGLMGDSRSFGRSDYVKIWEDQNVKLRVCPACDGQRADIRGGYRLSEVDHFLPDSLYPFFNLHPWNLVPICKECNRSKSNIDPIEYQGITSLTHSFHPYTSLCALDAINVVWWENPNGVLKVAIEDIEQPPTTPRVISLNSVFGLEERWSGRLDGVEELVKETISTLASKAYLQTDDMNIIMSELREGLEANQELVRVGSRPNAIIYKSYLSYVLSDREQFDNLLAQI